MVDGLGSSGWQRGGQSAERARKLGEFARIAKQNRIFLAALPPVMGHRSWVMGSKHSLEPTHNYGLSRVLEASTALILRISDIMTHDP